MRNQTKVWKTKTGPLQDDKTWYRDPKSAFFKILNNKEHFHQFCNIFGCGTLAFLDSEVSKTLKSGPKTQLSLWNIDYRDFYFSESSIPNF